MGGQAVAGWVRAFVAAAAVVVAGCGLPPVVSHEPRLPLPTRVERDQPPKNGVVQAAHTEPAAIPAPAGPARVDDLVAVAVARNPRLAKATFAIDAAQGRYIQAGLYPNPDLAINWDEIGDRTGPGGIIYLPKLSQTIVTGRKLSLAQAVAATEVDQATLALIGERYAVVGSVRAAFYDVYTLERRIEVLDELLQLADEAVKNGKNLLDNQKIARLDLVQLEVERERFRAEAEAAQRELPATRRKLAAVVGDPRMPVGTPTGRSRTFPLTTRTAGSRSRARDPPRGAIRTGRRRAGAGRRPPRRAEPIPNVNVYTGLHPAVREQVERLRTRRERPDPGVEPQPGQHSRRAGRTRDGDCRKSAASRTTWPSASRPRSAPTRPRVAGPSCTAPRSSHGRRRPTTCRSKRSRAGSSSTCA